MADHDTHDDELHSPNETPPDGSLRPASDGETYFGAKGVDEAVPSPTELAAQAGFGTQTLPYSVNFSGYGHHGTGMASQSAQFASLPQVTGPAGSGFPGREGTGMGSLHWQVADPNQIESSEIVAVVLEDTAAMHKTLPEDADHVVRFDHHSEAAIEPGLSAMSGDNEYHDDGTLNLGAAPVHREVETPGEHLEEDHGDHADDHPH